MITSLGDVTFAVQRFKYKLIHDVVRENDRFVRRLL